MTDLGKSGTAAWSVGRRQADIRSWIVDGSATQSFDNLTSIRVEVPFPSFQ